MKGFIAVYVPENLLNTTWLTCIIRIRYKTDNGKKQRVKNQSDSMLKHANI